MKGKMKDWFDEACWHAPTLLVLDNLDRMLGAEVEVRRYVDYYSRDFLTQLEQHADSFPALHLAHTFLALAEPALASRPIALLATAQSTTSLHPLLTTTHMLGVTISLRGPNKAARRDVSFRVSLLDDHLWLTGSADHESSCGKQGLRFQTRRHQPELHDSCCSYRGLSSSRSP